MFTIGKLAEKIGLTPDTLRYYEKEGFLRPVEWSEIGYRLYDAETIRRIRLIRQECGPKKDGAGTDADALLGGVSGDAPLGRSSAAGSVRELLEGVPAALSRVSDPFWKRL